MAKGETERQMARRLAITDVLPRLPPTHAVQVVTTKRIMGRVGPNYPLIKRTFERDLKG